MTRGLMSAPEKSKDHATREELAKETLRRILEVFRQLELFRNSPKFFIVYAHDNNCFPGLRAHAEVVKDFISWFKELLFNVDSDKSPHGWDAVHDTAHSGASNDIITNQLCLLPRAWHKYNVDQVLVFGSELLGKYLEDEQRSRIDDKTYTQALTEACRARKTHVPEDDRWRLVDADVRHVQEKYAKKMGKSFHHVLTELALLHFRNECEATKSTVPILLSGDPTTCFPNFIRTKNTTLRVEVGSQNQHQALFKILLMLEGLEKDRFLIETLRDCYNKSVGLLNGHQFEGTRYLSEAETILLDALRKNNDLEPYKRRGYLYELLGKIKDQSLPKHSKPSDDCLRSLAFPEMDDRINEIDAAAAGTCEWLPRHKEYTNWAACDRGLLWIKGKPGSGKSTLLRFALDNVIVASTIGTNAVVLSFFFHGRGVELQRTQLGLFRSLLYQLLSKLPDKLTDLVDVFNKHCRDFGKPGEKWHWKLGELRSLFKSSLTKALENQPVWLFVDALDESGKANATEVVRQLNFLRQTLPSTGLPFRTCFTCRHYPILDRDIGKDRVFKICPEHKNEADISTYVQSRLSASDRLVESTIPALITGRANGVFMWARLVVDKVINLDSEGAKLAAIEGEVNSLYPELDELYNKLVQDMRERPASLKLVQWICFATRPLTLDELRWAMVIDADCSYKSLQECQYAKDYVSDADSMESKLKTLSCGLAEAVPSSNARVVQFIHQSVKDFFVDKGLSSLDGSNKWVAQFIRQSARNIHKSVKSTSVEKRLSALDGSLDICLSTALIGLATVLVYLDYFTRRPRGLLPDHAFPLPVVVAAISAFWLHDESVRSAKSDFVVGTAHYRLSRTCIHYLAMEEIAQSAAGDADALISAFPLLHYATTSWVAHTRQSEARNSSQDDLLTYFASPSEALMELWVQVYWVLDKYSNDCPPKGTRMVHIASRYRWLGPLQRIVQSTDRVTIDIQDNNGRTPLSWAAEEGHEAVVRLLLDRGADIESKDGGYNQTPLSWAAEKGHEAVVRLLLDKGADIESKYGGYSQTPLSWAAGEGREAVVRLLLDKGADIESKDDSGQTPLWWAAARGHEAVVRLLLDKGADIESQDRWHRRTPLLWAVEKGHKAVVRLLLDKGADTESQDRWYRRTPLLWAVEKGHEAVVRLLLDKGADIESKDDSGRTPLSWAAGEGHEAVVRLLLDEGADIESKDDNGQTPLSWAAMRGHEAIVRSLKSSRTPS